MLVLFEAALEAVPARIQTGPLEVQANAKRDTAVSWNDLRARKDFNPLADDHKYFDSPKIISERQARFEPVIRRHRMLGELAEALLDGDIALATERCTSLYQYLTAQCPLGDFIYASFVCGSAWKVLGQDVQAGKMFMDVIEAPQAIRYSTIRMLCAEQWLLLDLPPEQVTPEAVDDSVILGEEVSTDADTLEMSALTAPHIHLPETVGRINE